MPVDPTGTNAAENKGLVAWQGAGLANRILLTASALRIAQETGRRLWLHWPRVPQLQCVFSDLFQCIGEESGKFPLDRKITVYTSRPDDFPRWLGRYLQRWPLPALEIEQRALEHGIVRTIEREEPADTLILNAAAFLVFKGEDESASFSEIAAQALGRLVPRPDIQDSVAEFSRQQRIGEGVVGVHIRRTDFPYADCNSDERFIAEIEAELARSRLTRFFLATDDQETELRYRRIFGSALITYPKRCYPVKRDAQRAWCEAPADNPKEYNVMRPMGAASEALCDLILLSRTARIIPTYGSSFSLLADWLAGRFERRSVWPH